MEKRNKIKKCESNLIAFYSLLLYINIYLSNYAH